MDIGQIKKRDFNIARKFAIEGMHLNWYISNRFELYIYSKYFWYLEISKATKVLGAYMGNNLVGILLADIKDEPKLYKSTWYKLFVKTISFFINILYKNASNTYDETNEKMLNEFKKARDFFELPECCELALRKKGEDRFFFVLNYARETVHITLKREMTDLYSKKNLSGKIELPAYGTGIYRIKG
jgi:hypothetical protein